MDLSKMTRPVWAEVDLDALAHNMREIRRITKDDAIITAVVKADGYGHGALEIGQTLLDNGATRFAVATLSEALQLRRKFKDTEILILGFSPSYAMEEVVKNDITQTIYSLEHAKNIADEAKKLSKTAKVHIKLDTGMRRLGMAINEETIETILEINSMENIEIEGIFTHFAVADEVDKSFTLEQVKRYNYIIDSLEEKGFIVPIKHVSNSAATIDMPELNYNMVRAGVMMYGLYPSPDVKKENIDLHQAMSLRAQISFVKEIEAGEGISYGLTYKAKSKEKIATVPIGYADGFIRLYGQEANAIVSDVIAPIVGRVCMDQIMINVTGIDCKEEDVITLFGKTQTKEITIDDVANYIGTINYEVVCMISRRVPRVYTCMSEVVKVKDYTLCIE